MPRVLLKLHLSFLFLFFWHRVLFLISFHDQMITPMGMSTTLHVILTGLRFDLMVLAYISMPALVIALLGQALKPSYQETLWRVIRGYYLVAIVFISAITVIDFMWFQVGHDRWSQSLNVATFLHSYKFNVFFVSITAAVIYLGYEAIQRIYYTQFELGAAGGWLGLLVWFALVVVSARGSFNENHLDLRHAKITENEFLNKSIIPSSYAFDQALRKRR